MSSIEPPPPPLVDACDRPPPRRVQRCLLQIVLASATIFATVWCYQVHVGLGLTATFLAKHIVVAIVAAGLRLPIRETK